jgi:hypothetical protein
MWAPSALGAVVGTIEALKLDGVSASVSKAVAGAKWTGQTTGDLIPSGAMVVTLRSALRGRRTRGRVFVPFVAEANNLNGVLVASNLALAQTAWTNFMGAMTTANAEFVIASYLGSFGTTVTSVTCQPIMATQRRRQSQLR